MTVKSQTKFMPSFILAHGQGLLSTMAVAVVLGVAVLATLIPMLVSLFSKSETASRDVHRFVFVAAGCLGFWILAGFVIQPPSAS